MKPIARLAVVSLLLLTTLPAISQPAPAHTFTIQGDQFLLDGKPFKLSDYKGKVVLLDFWGFW